MGILDKVSKNSDDVKSICSRVDALLDELYTTAEKLLKKPSLQIIKDLEALGVDMDSSAWVGGGASFEHDNILLLYIFSGESSLVSNKSCSVEFLNVFIESNYPCNTLSSLFSELHSLTQPYRDGGFINGDILIANSTDLDEFEVMVKSVIAWLKKNHKKLIDAVEDCLIESLGL